jgi:hypothetical protein
MCRQHHAYFRIETLTGLIEIYKAHPELLKRSSDPE